MLDPQTVHVRKQQSLGSGDWGVGPCQLSSADSIYDLTLQMTDNFLTPAVLTTCTALAHAARACSCMVCFSASLYVLNEALVRGPSASTEKNLIRVRRIPHLQVLDPRTVRVHKRQSLGSGDWGVRQCQLSSADSIYDLTLQMTDDFLTPAALMTCTALALATRAVSYTHLTLPTKRIV